MDIDEFAETHEHDRSGEAGDIFRKWKADRLLHASLGNGVILADLIHGDGLNDEVPDEVVDAFHNLTGGEVDSYAEARTRIAEQLREHDGDGVSDNWISVIKGRVGENRFLEHAEQIDGDLRLATDSNQEAYDVVHTTGGETRYISVKTSGDPGYIVDEMEATRRKIEAGEVTTPEGEVVRDVEYAVPSPVSEDVQARAAERGLSADVIPMDTTSAEAAGVVEAGVDAVGPEAVENLFWELTGGTAAAAAIHGLREGFLVYKGAKEMNQAARDAAEETAVTGGGLTAGVVVESAFREAALAGEPVAMAAVFGTSVTVRVVLGDVVKRSDYAAWMHRQNAALEETMGRVAAAGGRP